MRQDKMEIKKMRTVVFFGCLLLLFCLSTLAPALGEEVRQPDLTVTNISACHNDYCENNKVWQNLENTVEVEVKNEGSGDADDSFTVRLLAAAEEVGTESVSELAAGDTTTLRFSWHPTETGTYTLKAVADSGDEINESEEGNNELTADPDAEVFRNGYAGGDEPLTTFKHNTLPSGGGVLFTVGNSFYTGKLNSGDTYTVTHEVALPSGAKVELARLYSYWTWSKAYKPSLELAFEGSTLSPDAEYSDRKGTGWGSPYNYPTGTYAYDVSDFVAAKGSGTYTTVVENAGSDFFCMNGLGLLVVYSAASGGELEYWINEGCEMLCTKPECGGLTPAEATANSVFEGSVESENVERATLTTVVQSGGHLGTRLVFNNEDWTGVFDGTPYTDFDVDEEREVTDSLVSSENSVKIEAPTLEDGGGDYLVPSNAFLVLFSETEEEEEPPKITDWEPAEEVVSSTEGEPTTFKVTADQTVEISWQLNGTQVQTNESVTEATYTNTSAVAGIWNVSAVATNTETGLSARHTWLWNVTPVLNATPTPTPNPSPTPAANLTPTSTPSSATPTPLTPSLTPPTPTPTSVPKVTPTPALTPTPTTTPVPGFELPITLCGVLLAAAVVRVRQARKKKK